MRKTKHGHVVRLKDGKRATLVTSSKLLARLVSRDLVRDPLPAGQIPLGRTKAGTRLLVVAGGDRNFKFEGEHYRFVIEDSVSGVGKVFRLLQP